MRNNNRGVGIRNIKIGTGNNLYHARIAIIYIPIVPGIYTKNQRDYIRVGI